MDFTDGSGGEAEGTTSYSRRKVAENGIGLLVEADFFAWQRHDGALLGASRAMGDSDGDEDVDADDLMAFQLAFGPPPVFSGIVSVPEPGTIGLALLLAAGLWVWRWQSRVSRQWLPF